MSPGALLHLAAVAIARLAVDLDCSRMDYSAAAALAGRLARAAGDDSSCGALKRAVPALIEPFARRHGLSGSSSFTRVMRAIADAYYADDVHDSDRDALSRQARHMLRTAPRCEDHRRFHAF